MAILSPVSHSMATVTTVTKVQKLWHETTDAHEHIHAPETQIENEISQLENNIARHPLGVRPGGNALTADKDLCDSIGGFQKLPEDLLLLLLEWLGERQLSNLGATCRALYAYTSHDQLWRDLSIRFPVSGLKWRGSWRASRLKLANANPVALDCSNLFSDALHRPFFCSQIPLSPYTSNIPVRNEISKFSNLTEEEFAASWSNKPFILTEVVTKWPLYWDWNESTLLDKFGDTVFRAEAVDWPLKTYVEYMRNCHDESPLYLFDSDFADKMELEIGASGAYRPPECFGQDLFALLGEQRPDHRWLIVGPERSGSTFHKDPNATSAWNAVVRGSKYWIMFPASVIPPGVLMSEDQSEVTSPLSIAEWFLGFHAEARRTPGCIEGICGEGEALHVPSGWWHLVVNLEPAIAITQNFVPESHLRAAVAFLRDKTDQISGFKKDVLNPHKLLLERLQEQRPDLIQILNEHNTKKRKWEDVVQGDSEQSGSLEGFSFGFGDDTDDEVD